MKHDMLGFMDAVASDGPYANNLHLCTPHHSIFTGHMLFFNHGTKAVIIN